MRAGGVVVPPPGFDNGLRLLECVEDLAVEQFVPQLTDEALGESLVVEFGLEAHDNLALLLHDRPLDHGVMRQHQGDGFFSIRFSLSWSGRFLKVVPARLSSVF